MYSIDSIVHVIQFPYTVKITFNCHYCGWYIHFEYFLHLQDFSISPEATFSKHCIQSALPTFNFAKQLISPPEFSQTTKTLQTCLKINLYNQTVAIVLTQKT